MPDTSRPVLSSPPDVSDGRTAAAGPDSGVHVHTLPNGLVVLVEEMPHVRSAAYDLVVPGGIVTDAPDKVGASLLLAELITRGAGGFDSVSLSDAFDDRGISHGESAGHDRFTLRGALLAEGLDDAFMLLSTVVKNPHLPESEIEPVRSSLLQDISALEDNPSRKAVAELTRRYYPDPYGRPAVGTAEGLAACGVDDLRNDWSRRFRPDGAILSVAGAVDAAAVTEQAARWFGDWTGASEALPPFPELPGPETYHVETPSSQLQITMAYPSARFGHRYYYEAKVADGVLSGGMFGRLFVEVREKRGLCYSVFSRHSASQHHGTVLVYAGTTPERAAETEAVIKGELAAVRGTVKPDELVRAKANLKASLVIGEESSGARSASNAGDWWIHRRVRSTEEILAAVDAVSAETLDAYFDEFPPGRTTVLTLGRRDAADAGGATSGEAES